MIQPWQIEHQILTARRLFDKTEYWTDSSGKRHLIWKGAVAGQGYGYVSFWARSTRVHRVVWELVYDDPKNMHVLHKCDIRLCVDISHLFLGTDEDNKRDMHEKGRAPTINELGQYTSRIKNG